jgi:hypothetical protein
MNRPAPGTGGVKNDPPAPAPQEAEPEVEPVPLTRPRTVATGWRVALFLWVTAFGFLAAYELIWTFFKLLKIRQ